MPVLKLAVLGLDAQIEMLLDAARRRGDEIVIACDVAADDPRLAGVPRADAWEAIVDHRGSDAVLVGHDGWNEQRAEGVRKLVQAGRTILLSQPIDLSMLFAYELEMIRRDSGARMIPFLPERLHPYLATLRREIEASLASAGSIGSIEAVECTRRMGDRSRDIVLAQLARDGDLVRGLIGDPERISTLGGGDPERVWNTLSVGFSGATQVPLRWQVMRGDIAGLTIRLVGTEGSTSVEIPDGQVAEWTLRREPGDRKRLE
jgi:predicted dehydrogenase